MTSGQYHPVELEEKWAQVWEAAKPGKGDERSVKEKFSMVMPPPNVTGTLHLGHTMMAAIEDTIVRYQKMRGREVCWVPGLDHAGIATQSVVERQLLKTGVSRHDLGREEFVGKVWEWKEEKGGRILYQLRRLGCSCDWDREAFTFSKPMTEAVTEAFVRLHEKGLVYRDVRLVSWCPYLNTALSDIEVETDEFDKPDRVRVPGYDKTVEVGCLWQFKYQLKDDPTRFIEVATSRPETMLGDVAVAVNPNDVRYKDLVGKELIHPFIQDRRLVVVADEHCDPEFGTGAVKITPAHDKNDFEVGKRHNLENITVFTLDGRINEEGGDFAGMHRFEARVAIEKRLMELGLFVEKIKNPKKMAIPRCSRSGDIIEYMLLPQWYINCEGMAKRAADACRTGELRILPDGSEKQWYHWLDNTHDWCVSRQLWWGHRIPAYRVVCEGLSQDHWIVARSAEAAREQAEQYLKRVSERTDLKFTLEQDQDVLDTWFSSGLFPFSVYGWPNDTTSLSKFFPTDLLETGSDILFFWVARMVMLSLELMNQLPFSTVFLHPMVRDSHGKKMSKSTGNVVDPVDVIHGITLKKMAEGVKDSNLKDSEIKRALDALSKDFPNGIEECGADALRYGMLSYLKGGRSVNLDINRIVGYRHFCNKVWNATKFAMSYLDGIPEEELLSNRESTNFADKWILHRCNVMIRNTTEAYESYSFFDAVNETYSFFLYDFCDVYLELVKPRFQQQQLDKEDAARTLFHCLDNVLKMLHPMMPFITEESWNQLHNRLHDNMSKDNMSNDNMSNDNMSNDNMSKDQVVDLLINQPLPLSHNKYNSTESERQMNYFLNTVKAFRSMLAQFEVPPKNKLEAFVKLGEETRFMANRLDAVTSLAKLASCTVVETMSDSHVSDVTVDGIVVALNPAGSIDFKKVLVKLNKRRGQLEKLLEGICKKMTMPDYQTKVPHEVQEQNKQKLEAHETEKNELDVAISIASKFV
ncbi:valyl-tRNA synthetase [Gregarina niphandrodes]|uniref:valine--tRNA ligase n=1 Tax=Gregarina niphandrodes TaxID=110365 RepID=A0A023B7P6_GRENI|nr:valyl-tRNA synthetase [Gregarina niphandrodes]EZG67636.1 valyl-tRNA synthetase [Gregarina niphandrodes]|eukprot:XP_011130189.1 valyl-tRNA synthetase [Gregarina niphandrodes]